MSAKYSNTTEEVGQLVRLLLDHPAGYMVACVRACEGIADPVAEIQAMREALEDAHEAISRLDELVFGTASDPNRPGVSWPVRDELLDKLAKAKGGA